MSFSSTLVGGGGGAVIFSSPLQEESPATAIIVINRPRMGLARIDIDRIEMLLAGLTKFV
jgi:hypothetical protein